MSNPPNNLSKLSIDTNLFIDLLDSKSPFYLSTVNLFKNITLEGTQLVTSIITLTELLAFKAAASTIKELENHIFSIPNLTLIDVNKTIATEAGRIDEITD